MSIHATSAAYPWLASAYDCVPPGSAIVLSDGPGADLQLRLAEPEQLSGEAYQIGTDDLLIVTHPQVGVGALALAQVEALFAGQITNWRDVGGSDQPIQVWAFAPTVDVQEYFERTVLHGRPVSSLARLAVSAQHMSDSVGSVAGSVGLLPRRWKAGNTNEALALGPIPVLALPSVTPNGALVQLLACMQVHQ